MARAAAVTDEPFHAARPRGVENGVFAMLLLVFAEIMLFSGLVSSYLIARATALPGTWPPAGQPRLPFESTAVNTAALLASGVLLVLAQRAFQRQGRAAAVPLTGWALALGAFFVVFQGVEWARLLAQGLTLTSSKLGAYFYTLVGTHALHAVAAILALGWVWREMRAGRMTRSAFGGAQVFWYFVVLVWPVLYLLLYR